MVMVMVKYIKSMIVILKVILMKKQIAWTIYLNYNLFLVMKKYFLSSLLNSERTKYLR